MVKNASYQIIYWRAVESKTIRRNGFPGSEIQISKDNGQTWKMVKYFDVSLSNLTAPDLAILGDALTDLVAILGVVYDDQFELREWK